MSRTGLWLASAIVVVSNLCLLALAAVNRQGEPDAVLQLTEREARLEREGTENTGITLRLAWTDTRGSAEAAWFDRAKLEELGFDCSLKPTPENLAHYLRMPARQAYVAMEYDGPAWRRYVDTLSAGANPRVVDTESRLVLVDADRDAVRLRSRHPNRGQVVIVHALVGPAVAGERGHDSILRGRVVEVLPYELHVPRDLGRALQPLARRSTSQGDSTPAPRYQATVQWGRNLEPWVENVRVSAGAR